MAFLLDVNVLVALFWPPHEYHDLSRSWFRRHGQQGWATCSLTQAGFIRIVSNPAFSRDAFTVAEAIDLLQGNLKSQEHEFWPADIPFAEAVVPFTGRLFGHRQVTDAYLLGLAIHHKAKLVTFDTSVIHLLPEKSPGRSSIVQLTARN